MSKSDIVRARIDSDTKASATAALSAMGLYVEAMVPNAASRAAIAELEAGRGKRFTSANALFEDLGT